MECKDMLPTYINQVILEYDKVFALKCKKFLFYQVFAVEKIILLIIQMDCNGDVESIWKDLWYFFIDCIIIYIEWFIVLKGVVDSMCNSTVLPTQWHKNLM